MRAPATPELPTARASRVRLTFTSYRRSWLSVVYGRPDRRLVRRRPGHPMTDTCNKKALRGTRTIEYLFAWLLVSTGSPLTGRIGEDLRRTREAPTLHRPRHGAGYRSRRHLHAL